LSHCPSLTKPALAKKSEDKLSSPPPKIFLPAEH